MRVVFDTNVFIAAALRGGFAEDVIELADKGVITLLTSKEILEELRDKLISKFGISKENTKFFINKIKVIAKIVESREKLSVVKSDPDDDKILECGLAGKADLIVSADKDLLRLKTFRGIAIIHPKAISWTFPEYFKKRDKQ